MLTQRLTAAALRMPALRSGHLPRPRGHVRAYAGSQSMEADIKQKNKDFKVIVYSKSYCPYCSKARALFHDELGVDAKFVELDQIADGAEVQDTLQGMTGQRTVPQVFIAEEFLGGASETLALHEQGEIVKKLDAAGVQHQ